MKKILQGIGLSCLALALMTGSDSNAGNGTFISTATIIAPLAIAKTGGGDDMTFGSIAASGTLVGTAVLNNADGVVYNTVQDAGGTPTSLDVTLTGTSGLTYAFAATPPAVLSNGAGQTMTLNTFTTDCTGTLPGATEDCQFGGTLNVGIAQLAGAYSTASAGGTAISITVDYN